MKTCDRCGDVLEAEEQEEHTCPYACAMNDDCETLCNCCDKCYHDCLLSI